MVSPISHICFPIPPPQLISASAETIVSADPPYPRLSVNVDKVAERVDLKISSAEVTDSAMYYCVLRPTMTGNPDTLQYSGSGLQFLYLVTTTNKPHEVKGDQQDLQLSVTLNKERTRVDLEISSAEVTDSALYYCALKPTVTGRGGAYYCRFKNTNSPIKTVLDFTPTYNLSYNMMVLYTVTVFSRPSSQTNMKCMERRVVMFSFPATTPQHTVYCGINSIQDQLPQFFLFIHHASRTVVRAKPPYPRLTVKLNKKKTCVDREISSAEVIPPYTDVEMASERDRVTLSCNYTSDVTLQWYRQYPKSAPQLLVMEYVDNTPGFTLNHHKKAKGVVLEISSAEVTDSALKHCSKIYSITSN
ncbi:unnamed protein product [Coregonus sp. 'balchen']|nr:unnamed protein product [Coregonus sp. 'balchen']